MVEKTKKIVHKRRELQYSGETLCGVWLADVSVIRDRWRGVTCKRCLRSKPKKGAPK